MASRDWEQDLFQSQVQAEEEERRARAKEAPAPVEPSRGQRIYYATCNTCWGVSFLVFLISMLVLCVTRPALVCSLVSTQAYATPKLHLGRVLITSGLTGFITLLLCLSFPSNSKN